MRVKAISQLGGANIIDSPESGDHIVGAREEKRACKRRIVLSPIEVARRRGSDAGLAPREKDQPAPHVEAEHLEELESSVVLVPAAAARREADLREHRIEPIELGVARDVNESARCECVAQGALRCPIVDQRPGRWQPRAETFSFSGAGRQLSRKWRERDRGLWRPRGTLFGLSACSHHGQRPGGWKKCEDISLDEE